jgi:hypothetical protein
VLTPLHHCAIAAQAANACHPHPAGGSIAELFGFLSTELIDRAACRNSEYEGRHKGPHQPDDGACGLVSCDPVAHWPPVARGQQWSRWGNKHNTLDNVILGESGTFRASTHVRPHLTRSPGPPAPWLNGSQPGSVRRNGDVSTMNPERRRGRGVAGLINHIAVQRGGRVGSRDEDPPCKPPIRIGRRYLRVAFFARRFFAFGAAPFVAN